MPPDRKAKADCMACQGRFNSASNQPLCGAAFWPLPVFPAGFGVAVGSGLGVGVGVSVGTGVEVGAGVFVGAAVGVGVGRFAKA